MTVMPCFDKKLEASRDDFYQVLLPLSPSQPALSLLLPALSPLTPVCRSIMVRPLQARADPKPGVSKDVYSTKDVDCVITGAEVDLMLADSGVDLAASDEGLIDS